MTQQQRMSKAEILEQIEQSWTDLNQLLATVPKAQLTALKDGNGWSVKDHLAHIAAWESSVEYLVDGKDVGREMGVPHDIWASKDIDAINDVLYDQRAALTVDQVLDAFQTTHQRVVDRLAALPEADFHRPYNVFEPSSERRYPLSTWIVGNTYEHYDEHREWLEDLLESAG